MTTLILAERRIFSSIPIRGLCLSAENYLAHLNRHGALTIICLVIIASGIGSYIWMMMIIFNLGVGLREFSLQSQEGREELRRLEVLERQREAEFTVRHREYLERMDKVSALKYLKPGDDAVSRVGGVVPQQ